MTLKYVQVLFKDVPHMGVFVYDKLRWVKTQAEIVDRPHNAYRVDKYEVKQFEDYDEVRVVRSILPQL